ncbi:MAG: hypothetical protein LBT37_06385 [Lactobacillaceae bacterium]|jgi:hypothetical protein|nr:hypothetical protein [Lactobacillaceae bacterium]
MEAYEQETTIYRDGDSKIMRIDTSVTADRNRLIKLSKEVGFELVKYSKPDNEYVSAKIDLSKYYIRYGKNGLVIKENAKGPEMTEGQRLAASERMKALRASQG